MTDQDLGQKPCKRCGHMLPFSAYPKVRTGYLGLRTVCKRCYSAAQRERREQVAEQRGLELGPYRPYGPRQPVGPGRSDRGEDYETRATFDFEVELEGAGGE